MSILLDDDSEFELMPNNVKKDNEEDVSNEVKEGESVSIILVGGGTPRSSTAKEYHAYSKSVNCDFRYGVVTFTDLNNKRYTIINAPVTIRWDAYLKVDD